MHLKSWEKNWHFFKCFFKTSISRRCLQPHSILFWSFWFPQLLSARCSLGSPSHIFLYSVKSSFVATWGKKCYSKQIIVSILSLFLSAAFSDTQLILAILFLILEKFVLCFSSIQALRSRNRGQNGVSDHLSQKHQSLLKIEPLHHFARVDSVETEREEVLIHFTSAGCFGEFPQSLSQHHPTELSAQKPNPCLWCTF